MNFSDMIALILTSTDYAIIIGVPVKPIVRFQAPRKMVPQRVVG
jgi:hypothetical protein